jgi:plasmid maintenance system antidote protein VapI
MEQETGTIVEKVVRRSGVSIAELARRIHVDRRSIYYWFKQDNLNPDIIYRIGKALNHDFSSEIPSLSNDFRIDSFKRDTKPFSSSEINNVHYWKNKYIALLEKYNELLVNINSE